MKYLIVMLSLFFAATSFGAKAPKKPVMPVCYSDNPGSCTSSTETDGIVPELNPCGLPNAKDCPLWRSAHNYPLNQGGNTSDSSMEE